MVRLRLGDRAVEDRFNRKFGYPWVFLNGEYTAIDAQISRLRRSSSRVFER